MGSKDKANALIIQLNEDQRQVSKFEQVNQYYILCKNNQDKFLILFAMKKLAMISGKTVIYANDIIEAYRLKFFFNRFHMKAFVLSPELAQQQTASIIHFFSIGQFDILIALNDGYNEGQEPVLTDISYVVNFDVPNSYASYKKTGSMVERSEGAIINLVSHDDKKEEMLGAFQKKMTKAFGKEDILKCIPIVWHEIVKMKGRVEHVLSTLSNKRVRDEKLLEFKK